MRQTWYHGASSDEILADGFQVIENMKMRTDPGDLGLGIYFSLDPRMSLHYGDRIYKCSIEMDHVALIANPYRLWDQPQSDFPSRLFRWLAFDHEGGLHQEDIKGFRNTRKLKKMRREKSFEPQIYSPGRMKTVHNSYSWRQRFEVSKKIRQYFLKHGYTGIAMSAQNGELAIFDPNIIREKTLIVISDSGYENLQSDDADQIPEL